MCSSVSRLAKLFAVQPRAARLLIIATLAVTADWAGAQELGGFVEALTGARIADGPAAPRGAYTAREARLELSLADYGGDAEYFARLDAVGDAVAAAGTEVELREAFFTYSGFRAVDFKIGRQVVTWGTGDLLFVNDVFAKDWESFFIGRDLQYLKAPMDAVRLGLYPGSATVNVVLLPAFHADRLPSPERLGGFAPTIHTPDPTLSESAEIAVRLARSVGSAELAAYAFAGRFRQPLGMTSSGTSFYPGLNVFGASWRGNAWGTIGKVEVGYYQSRDDGDGTRPGVENSSLRALAGFDRQLASDWQLGVQAYVEVMGDYDAYLEALPPGTQRRDEVRQLYTLRLTRTALQETLRFSVFAFGSPTDEDHHLRASAVYKLTDEVALVAGTHVFGGQSAMTAFGQQAGNDNVFFRARYAF